MQVLVRDNNVDQALKALKKEMQREGIFREMKLRGHYEKPSEKKAREKAEAVRRGTHVDPRKARTLFRDFAELWHELYIADRANTARGYADALRVHLLPTFGHLRLGRVL